MGFEVQLVIAHNGSALCRALAQGDLDPELVALLGTVVSRNISPDEFAAAGGPYDPERAWLATWARHCSGVVDLGRRFGGLIWALGVHAPGVDRAVVGEHTLATPRDPEGVVRSSQGFAVRWNSVAACVELAGVLSGLDPEEVEAAVRPRQMQGVYKAHGLQPGDVARDLQALQALYAQAAAEGGAMLILKG